MLFGSWALMRNDRRSRLGLLCKGRVCPIPIISYHLTSEQCGSAMTHPAVPLCSGIRHASSQRLSETSDKNERRTPRDLDNPWPMEKLWTSLCDSPLREFANSLGTRLDRMLGNTDERGQEGGQNCFGMTQQWMILDLFFVSEIAKGQKQGINRSEYSNMINLYCINLPKK